MIHFLSTGCNYDNIIRCQDINMATEYFIEHINNSYEHFCPPKSIKIHGHYLFKPSNELLTKIRKKRSLYRKFKRLKNKNPNSISCLNAWEAYKSLKNEVTKISRLERKQLIINDLMSKSSKNDIKGIWKTIKHASFLPTKSGKDIPPFSPDIANEYFCNIGPQIQNDIGNLHSEDNFKLICLI